VRFENEDILVSGPTAMAMGNYFFTNTTGVETKVEYSFGYFIDSDDSLRINLHHSSLPYDPDACWRPSDGPVVPVPPEWWFLHHLLFFCFGAGRKRGGKHFTGWGVNFSRTEQLIFGVLSVHAARFINRLQQYGALLFCRLCGRCSDNFV